MANASAALFRADWLRVVFIHIRVRPDELQPLVPFELDTFRGDAYVSLVAFTQARLRPAGFGRIGEILSAPVACHEFLNLRTYIRHDDRAGIFFLGEWIPNRLAVLIGPRTYGLPYRLGRLDSRCHTSDGRLGGAVRSGRRSFLYRGAFDPYSPWQLAAPGSLDDFLLERYHAFTWQGTLGRTFHVSHAPWSIKPVRVQLFQTSLFDGWGPLSDRICPVAAHVSPGVTDVMISAPNRMPLLQRAGDGTRL
jgi:uncharacterized protein YqjF (DUF2071 family)